MRPRKTAYVDRAVPLGRFNLHNDFIQQSMLISFIALMSASGTLGFETPLWLVVVLAAAMLATMLVLQYRLAPREEERLRSWLRRAGREAGVDAGRLGEERDLPWRCIPHRGLRRCRPGWMVALDASAKAAFVAAVIPSPIAVWVQLQAGARRLVEGRGRLGGLPWRVCRLALVVRACGRGPDAGFRGRHGVGLVALERPAHLIGLMSCRGGRTRSGRHGGGRRAG